MATLITVNKLQELTTYGLTPTVSTVLSNENMRGVYARVTRQANPERITNFLGRIFALYTIGNDVIRFNEYEARRDFRKLEELLTSVSTTPVRDQIIWLDPIFEQHINSSDLFDLLSDAQLEARYVLIKGR